MCKDVDVGRQVIRFVERADADEAHRVARTGVVAPQGHAAVWTANDLLPLAAVLRRIHRLRCALHKDDAIGFDHCIEGEGCYCFALTPAAVSHPVPWTQVCLMRRA